MKYRNIREEELKGKVGKDWFEDSTLLEFWEMWISVHHQK